MLLFLQALVLAVRPLCNHVVDLFAHHQDKRLISAHFDLPSVVYTGTQLSYIIPQLFLKSYLSYFGRASVARVPYPKTNSDYSNSLISESHAKGVN